MEYPLSGETVLAVAPVSLAATTATAIEVDLSRAYGVTFELTTGVVAGVVSVFKIQGATESDGTFADIAGATLTTLPGATDDRKVYAIHVDLRDRTIGQFMEVVLTTTGSAGVYGVNARIWGKDEGSASATARGYAAEVFA